MSFGKLVSLTLGLGYGSLVACSAVTDPASAMNGMYTLERSIGRGPATGTLILTSKGYAERRVRYRESNGGTSEEYLARGTAAFMPDSTITLELREMNLVETLPWTPDARLVGGGAVEISYLDPLDGSTIVESYRRQD